MLRKAGRIHAVRWGSALAVLLLIGFVIGNVIAAERQRSLRRQVATALDAVQNNRGLAVPFTLRDLERLPRELVVAELKARYANAEPQHKLGLAYAMARYGQVDVPFLVSRIQRFSARGSRQPCRGVRAGATGLIGGDPRPREKSGGGKELASQGPPGCRRAPPRR